MSAELQSEAAFESGVLGFIHRQWFVHRKPVPSGIDLVGRTAIITGANGGLGLEAARQLLKLGLSSLILAVRSLAKGDTAAKELRETFPTANIQVRALDMASYDSIQKFVVDCKNLERIDIVILNAGLQNASYNRVADTGHEQSLQVNYYSTALLAILLLPILKSMGQLAAHPPVLTIVTSDTAYWSSLATDGPVLAQLDREDGYNEFNQYMGTKLLQMIFMVKLAEHVNADDVVINMANPGWCAGTGLGSESPISKSLLNKIFKALMARTLEVGGSTYIDAVVVQGKASHGSFCSDWSLRPYPPLLYTEAGQQVKERLWEETMEELKFAGASQIVQRMQS